MQKHLSTLAISALFLWFACPTFFSCAAAAQNQAEPKDLLRSYCIHARYPNLCLQTLSSYAGQAKTPLDLAQAAVKVSLAQARRLSDYLNTLQVSSAPLGRSPSKRQRVALSDCARQMSDSVVELSKTFGELQHLRVGAFNWQKSNAQTWVSAALTNGYTCLDGFNDNSADQTLKFDVKRRITDVAGLYSNALYLISCIGDTRNGKPRSNSNP